MPLLASTFLLVFLASACAARVWDEPYPVYEVELPRDDAAHDAPVAWWYWVGHLTDESGDRLAFQLSFFRAAAWSLPATPCLPRPVCGGPGVVRPPVG